MREVALWKEIFIVQEELAASRVDCVSLRWGPNEMLLQMRQEEVDAYEALKTVSNSSTAICAQMCSAVREGTGEFVSANFDRT